MNRINHLAVWVAAIVNWLIGGLWYSPVLFGNKFIQLMGWNEQELAKIAAESHMIELIVAFVISILVAYVLAYLISRTNSQSLAGGVKIGLLTSLCLVAAVNLESIMFEFRKPGLFIINNSYHVAGFAVMGAIIGAWKSKSVVAPDLAYKKAAS